MTELKKAINNLKSELFKAKITKYIKRIPKAGGGYKYIYKESGEKEKKIEEIKIDESGINDEFGNGVGWREYKVKNGILYLGHEGRAELQKNGPEVKYPYFFRATNNTKESELGDFKSTNAITGQKEKGVSVSSHPKYAIFNNLKHLYAVTGDIVGYGSDGEPLLKNIKYIKKLNINRAEKEYDETRYLKRIKFLHKLGMTDIAKINGAIKSIWGPGAIDKDILKNIPENKIYKIIQKVKVS